MTLRDELLAARFERDRPHLRAVAYRMLGSLSEAEDAVQEAWLRLARTDRTRVDGVANLTGWLTTVVSRVCLDVLRARRARPEEPLADQLPDPIVTGPDEEAELADAVGIALLVVLETLPPAERLAFVLHDLFGVPFAEIGPITGRSADAAKMLASRARRRVRDARAEPDPDRGRQQAVVDAFLAASRAGDFDALVAVLDPEVVLRVDSGPGRMRPPVRGAAAVAGQALLFARIEQSGRPVLVGGVPGVVNTVDGRASALLAFTVVDGRITAMDILADPDRLAGLGL